MLKMLRLELLKCLTLASFHLALQLKFAVRQIAFWEIEIMIF